MKISKRSKIALGILLVELIVISVVFSKGYYKTWQGYRDELSKDMNACMVENVILIGEAMGCFPKNDPIASFKECLIEQDLNDKVTYYMVLNACFQQEEDSENSTDI